jgi:hypothetical protein
MLVLPTASTSVSGASGGSGCDVGRRSIGPDHACASSAGRPRAVPRPSVTHRDIGAHRRIHRRTWGVRTFCGAEGDVRAQLQQQRAVRGPRGPCPSHTQPHGDADKPRRCPHSHACTRWPRLVCVPHMMGAAGLRGTVWLEQLGRTAHRRLELGVPLQSPRSRRRHLGQDRGCQCLYHVLATPPRARGWAAAARRGPSSRSGGRGRDRSHAHRLSGGPPCSTRAC